MIWLVSTILACAVIVLYVMALLAEAGAWPFRWLFGGLDNFHSELKARRLVKQAKRELEERRAREQG